MLVILTEFSNLVKSSLIYLKTKLLKIGFLKLLLFF